MNAERTLLSKITQGQKILVVELPDNSAFDFARKSDPDAVVRSVTRIATVPGKFTSKTYRVQITGGRTNVGRGGTTHVYVPVDVHEEPAMRQHSYKGVEFELPANLHGEALGRVLDEARALIDAQQAAEGADDDDEPATPELTDENAATADRCGKCKGFGVVRKRGSQAGKPYRTANGAAAATANGNSETCPTCKGELLVAV